VPSFAREATGALSALGVYRVGVVPLVRREVMRWRGAAASIPDPLLRAQALDALEQKALNVEATAVFGTLAPRRTRPAAVRAMTALQVAIDYLDTLGEQPVAEPLRNGLRLHEALIAALNPGAEPGDWYRFHPQSEDGGYLDGLVAACQKSVAALPAHRIALPPAQRAAARCGEGQSYTHAAASDRLEAWASSLDAPPAYRWWEVAAGASSSVAAHALVAAAADPRTSVAEAESIDAAYFPSVGALTVLLDDLIDRAEDAADGTHNYIAYYADSAEAADRLDSIARLASSALARLRHPHRHSAILTGVAGFYLSAPEADAPYARPIRDRLLRSTGPAVRPIVAVMRRRRNR
jgi:tetraprenyl-beta-curcumene synthase